MAFLTTRIDKLPDNDIRHSARSYSSSMSCGTSGYNLSCRSYGTSQPSIRQIDSALFIENNVPLTTTVSSEDVDVNCSAMLETGSDIVPPLDIQSEENYPTNRDYTYSYRNQCESGKIVLKPDKAFETWLSAKRKSLSDEAARRKKEAEIKQKELEERKRLATEKYERWLQKKSQSSITLKSSTSKTDSKIQTNSENRQRIKVSAEEAQTRLEEWERAKRLEKERRQMLKRQEEQRRRELEDQRRQMSVDAWQNWIASADKKPKPVPLNRGIFTLRGTVSDIFVNPNEWKPIIPTTNEN